MQRGSFAGFASILKPQTLPDCLNVNATCNEAACAGGDGGRRYSSSSRGRYSSAPEGSRSSVDAVVRIERRTFKRRKLSGPASTLDGDAPPPIPEPELPSSVVTETSPSDSSVASLDNAAPPKPRDRLHQLMFSPTLFSPVRKPKNPIVLCHGLYGFDVRGPAGSAYQLHYWGTILEILRGKVGAEVIVSRVPGTGSIEGRARALDSVLRKEVPGRDINLLAHSMGGLDARYLISNIRPDAYNIASLTTISTPHRGSPFMEWCSSRIGLGRDVESKNGESARSALAYWMGIRLAEYFAALFDSPAYRDLLPSYLEKRFNPVVPDMPSVQYFSVAARCGDLGIWHPLYWPKAVLDASEAKALETGLAPPDDLRGNDGLVAVESAKWGDFLGTVEDCDHWRIRGSSGFRTAYPLKQKDAEEVVPEVKVALEAAPVEDLSINETRSSSINESHQAATEVPGTHPEHMAEAALDPLKSDVAAKSQASKSWSWEDVNTVVDPLRALVSPLNRLLSLVPSRAASTSVPNTKTSSTTRFITPSLTFFKPAKPLFISPTTRFITLSHAFSPPPLGDGGTFVGNKAHEPLSSAASGGGGLLSYFRRSPSNAPSPTTRYLQLSVVFSPLREPPPSVFRSIPNLSSLLAPPSFFGSSTQKAASRQGQAAEAGTSDAFNLERLYVALARNLHDHGL